MTNASGLLDVEIWFRKHSRRRAAGLALWPRLLAAADPDTGEIALTRKEMAATVGIAPRAVSEIMTELANIKAIERQPDGRETRYFIHPLRRGKTVADPDPRRPMSPIAALAAAASVMALAAGGWALWTGHVAQAEIEGLRQHAEETRAAGERWRQRLAAIVAGPGEAAGHGRAEIEASLTALVADRSAAVERAGNAERNLRAGMEEIAGLRDRLAGAEQALAAASTRHADEHAATEAELHELRTAYAAIVEKHRQEIGALAQRADAAARNARAELAARDREIAALRKTRGAAATGSNWVKVPAAAARVESVAGAAAYGHWTLRKGETLRQVLERWTAAAGVELVYVTNWRYTLYAPWRAAGTLEEAVQHLMSALKYLPTPPVATFSREGRSLVLRHGPRKEAARPAA